MDWSVMFLQSLYPSNILARFSGQVIALFIVGLGEYGTVWLGTDWDKEVQKGIERNEAEAKRRALYERNAVPSSVGSNVA